jgi:DNA-binding NarL/FixJ family response regulator
MEVDDWEHDMTGIPRVLVADDHPAMLETLVALLADGFEVVAAVRDGASVVTQAGRLQPDVLVLDIAMPGLSGLAAAARLKEQGFAAKIVFVTNMRDPQFVERSHALGEVGFVAKERLVSDLARAIRRVLDGERFVSPGLTP